MNYVEWILHLIFWLRCGPIGFRLVSHLRPPTTSPAASVLRVPSWIEIARRLHPELTLKGVGHRIVFLWRCLAAWPYASAWFAWLHHSVLGPVATTHPALYKKIVRPYVTPQWNHRRRLQALYEHYAFVLGRMTSEVWPLVFAAPGLPLLGFSDRAGRRYRVFMGYEGRCNKEGETSLLLRSEPDSQCVCSLTALVIPLPTGGRGLLIGAIQGMPAGSDKSIIRELARSLHGLRPKALLLFLAQELACIWDLERVLGISRDWHVSRHLVYRLNRSRRPALNYDEFWRESGGRRNADGLYELRRRHAPRDLEELKPTKRTLYRKRYALLEDLRRQFSAGLRPHLQRVPSPREESRATIVSPQ